ncbi:hypothetical protein LCGC14_1080880 [marine sediment metagenome]|uniref:Uncharacterized protein n=1 Tax=marine sediment metagenome TaxID=412755 RepID=A0A0F9MK25_9ZZZZ
MNERPKKQTISFFGTVGAGANLTLVSQLITGRFKTSVIRASFAPGVERLMTLKYFISFDPSAPTTEQPKGINILQQTGQVPFITGDDEFKSLEHEVLQNERNAFLKVFAENADSFEHTIDTQITIEYLDDNDDAGPDEPKPGDS